MLEMTLSQKYQSDVSKTLVPFIKLHGITSPKHWSLHSHHSKTLISHIFISVTVLQSHMFLILMQHTRQYIKVHKTVLTLDTITLKTYILKETLKFLAQNKIKESIYLSLLLLLPLGAQGIPETLCFNFSFLILDS
jgi:hypothetical protein